MTHTTIHPGSAIRSRLPRPALRAGAPAEVSDRAFAAVVGACMLAVACFLAHGITAWNPHEDGVLALFSGRGSLPDLYETVFRRGGAPLHFTLAWVDAHLGGGLYGLRAISAIFAVASVPVVALLSTRLAGRAAALVTTVLMSASWMLLFHGVYARMYSLFLFTSALSYLALLRAVERDSNRAWALWALAILATAATHTYGAIVLVSEGLWVLLVRAPLRRPLVAAAAVAIAGIPLWRLDLVLAGRYGVGVGSGGAKLRGPDDVLRYFFHVAGDFTAGWRWAVWTVLAVAAVGSARLARTRRPSALLVGATIATPVVVFLAARVGSAASPATRHMIFALPCFLTVVAVGLLRLRLPVLVAAAVVTLGVGEVAWGWHRMPSLYRGDPPARVAARDAAAAWFARVARPDDVLLGYDPVFDRAWERGGAVSRLVVPRADPTLAVEVLREAPKPLGHGVFVFDASDTNNYRRRLHVSAERPFPRGAFEVRSFGPFVVVRTRKPTRTPREFLLRAQEAELLGKSMLIGDADVNYLTVSRALRALR